MELKEGNNKSLWKGHKREKLGRGMKEIGRRERVMKRRKKRCSINGEKGIRGRN